MSADALLEQAASVASAELRRARGRLCGLDPETAQDVERAAHAFAAKVARYLVEAAERDPRLASALHRSPSV